MSSKAKATNKLLIELDNFVFDQEEKGVPLGAVLETMKEYIEIAEEYLD